MSVPAQERILLSEWAGDSTVPRLLGAGTPRQPCPICGHPTMDCTHDVPGGQIMTSSNQTSNDDEARRVRTAGSGDEAVTVTDTDKIEGVYEDTDNDALVTITKDVVEEFYYPGTKRPAHRILFVKGQVVRKAEIDRLNSNVEARKAAASRDADEPVPLEEHIDPTTIASGTGANAPESTGKAKASKK